MMYFQFNTLVILAQPYGAKTSTPSLTHKSWKQGGLEKDDITLETCDSDHINEDIFEQSTKATKMMKITKMDGKPTIDHLS